MKTFKIYKTDENDANPTFLKEYDAEQPRTANSMHAADAFGAPQTLHLAVPDPSGDSRHYAPTKRQSTVYQGVQYLADNEGQGTIILQFDGVKDIATVVSEWNAANVGNEVSHNAPDSSAIPDYGTVELEDDGVWHLVLDSANIAAALTEDATAQITALYEDMKADVLADMAATFGTTDPDSANAYLQTWEKMVSAPSTYSGQGLTAWVATTSFATGDALDDDTKVTNYATECIAQAETYAVNRMVRIQQFRNSRDAILNP